MDSSLHWKTKSGFCTCAIMFQTSILNLETLWIANFPYFHSIIRYGIIFWGNATNSCKVFKWQKKKGNKNCMEQNQQHLVEDCLGNLNSYLFHVNIYCLMQFIRGNPNKFQTGLEIHWLHTRSKNQLFIPIANLTSVQKGITYSGIKI